MIFLYTLLLLLVGVVHFLIKRRVAAVEKKYTGVVKEADELLRQGSYREGNSNRQDPYQTQNGNISSLCSPTSATAWSPVTPPGTIVPSG